MALSLKNKLFDYFAQRHFDLMSPEVRARFDEYAKNGDFQGHMKHWNDNYKGAMLPDLVNSPVGVPNTHQLSPAEWKELFYAFREAFQNMDEKKEPSFGFVGPYKTATKDFIKKWFGDDTKVFTTTTATPAAETILTNLKNFLNDRTVTAPATLSPYSALKPLLTNALKDVFSDGLDYDGFIDGLDTKRYNSDLGFRKKVERVIYYIQRNGPREDGQVPSEQEWPRNIGFKFSGTGIWSKVDTVDAVLDSIYAADTDNWFSMANETVHIDKFKKDFTEIFDKLLTNSSIRKDFLAEAPSTIADPLSKAVESTDYENKDSKDYVSEKYPDEKTWVQELEDWKNDTYENHFRRFTNPSRGTRLFFSPWSQNIIKAFDKVKIKPTDGLEGILSKKSDILSKLQSSKTSTDHFNWFVGTIEKLKGTMPKTVEGALRNGGQMNQLVSGLIAEAVKQGKTKEAKTALEILSVAKYGLSTSRTLNKLREDKELFNVFSNKDLSWNKNEGVKFVTGAIDKTIRAGMLGVGLAVTGARNLISHSRTKIGKDISKNKILNDAHKHWNEEDLQKTTTAKRDAATHNLAELAAGGGRSGTVIANAADLAAAEAALGGMPAGPAHDNLESDIKLYKQSIIEQHDANQELADIAARQAGRAAPGDDPFQELVAYWNMLENTTKTHAFSLGSMAVKRKNMLENWGNHSNAETIASTYRTRFGTLRTA